MPKTPLKDSFKRIPTSPAKAPSPTARATKPVPPMKAPAKTMPVSTTASRSKGFSKTGPEQKRFNAAQLAKARKK